MLEKCFHNISILVLLVTYILSDVARIIIEKRYKEKYEGGAG